MIYVLAVGVVIVVGILGFFLYRNKKNKVQIFDNTEQLIEFIRKKYSSEIKHQQVIYGFVLEDASIQRTLQDSMMGELGRAAVDVQVNLVTKNGYVQVDAPCGNTKAQFKKGDLVVVLPIHNERHGFWHYVTVAKLQPIYDGKNKSWIVIENYLQN